MVITFIHKTLGVLCGVAIMLMQAPFRDSYQIKVSGPVTIGTEWVELNPKSPLKADKSFQWVLLDLKPPLKDAFYNEGGPTKGILMPDGDVINPEIEVVDQYGNKFNFVYKGSRGGPIYGYPNVKELPRDREYKTIRIRSPKPIKCKAIYWYCESSKDWP